MRIEHNSGESATVAMSDYDVFMVERNDRAQHPEGLTAGVGETRVQRGLRNAAEALLRAEDSVTILLPRDAELPVTVERHRIRAEEGIDRERIATLLGEHGSITVVRESQH